MEEFQVELENHRWSECVKKETDMKLDVKLEDFTSNCEAEMIDLIVKTETGDVKDEKLIINDIKEEINHHM